MSKVPDHTLPLEELEVGCAKREIWKWVRGCKGSYQVSNLGRVKSIDRVVKRSDGSIQTFKGRILKAKPNKNGYLGVSCFKSCSVHVLVAEAYIPNPNNLPEVNHKDGIKAHCWADNLEWTTKKGNMEHASQIGLASGGSMPGEQNAQCKLTEDLVRAIRLDPRRHYILARELDVSSTLIILIRKRKAWKHVV